MSCAMCGLKRLDLNIVGQRYFVYPIVYSEATRTIKLCEKCFDSLYNIFDKFGFNKIENTSFVFINATPFLYSETNPLGFLNDTNRVERTFAGFRRLYLFILDIHFYLSNSSEIMIDLSGAFVESRFYITQFRDNCKVGIYYDNNVVINSINKKSTELPIYEHCPVIEFGFPNSDRKFGWKRTPDCFGIIFPKS